MGGQNITLHANDGRSFEAYMARSARQPAPGVVVLQEIFGLNRFVRTVVDRLADRGFIAVAPDLFWRQEPGVQLDVSQEADRNRAMALFKGLDERSAVEDCARALEFLRASQLCTGKVAAVGYCLGGKLAYLMATRTTINAAVSYYGVGIQTALDEVENLRAPLLLHIAGADNLCPPAAQAQIMDRMTHVEAPPVELHVYEGASHAFARSGSSSYADIPAALAEARSASFLDRYLRGGDASPPSTGGKS